MLHVLGITAFKAQEVPFSAAELVLFAYGYSEETATRAYIEKLLSIVKTISDEDVETLKQTIIAKTPLADVLPKSPTGATALAVSVDLLLCTESLDGPKDPKRVKTADAGGAAGAGAGASSSGSFVMRGPDGACIPPDNAASQVKEALGLPSPV